MNVTAVEVVDDAAATGANVLAGAVAAAIAGRGRCTLALSRGSTLYRRLAAAGVQWDIVDVIQVDERAAPDGAAERNLTSLESELIATVEGRPPRVHPMPVTGDLEKGADAYAAGLEREWGSPPVLDVVHLGIGPDGHTASLVPGDPVLDVRDGWVAVTGVYEGCRRMTLTYPVLDAARVVVFVAAGAAKAPAVASLLAGDTSIPAARITASDVRIVIDPAAAAKTQNRL